MKIIIDVDSETGLIIALQSFVYHCSEDILPKGVDREQLAQNIQSMMNLTVRKHWINIGINNEPKNVEQ